MRAARRRGVLGVLRCGTGPSSRVRARAPTVQPLLAAIVNVVYMRFKARGAGGSNRRRASPGDVTLEHALR